MARDNKASHVYGTLRDEILKGVLRPGEPLSVLKVADRFSASRTPVRDAFVRLQSDGLVSLIDRQGARVSSVSIRSVRELFEMRILLEGAATRQVAAGARTHDGIRRAFGDLRDQFDGVARDESTPVDSDRFYELTEAYDQAIISHAANQYLSRTIAELRPHSARLRIIAHSPKRLAQSRDEHLALCRAIVDADPDAAAAACVQHLRLTEETILAAVMESTTGVQVDLIAT
ncbi:GntR family transcriptional regulator [Mycolicibacterium sp. P9-64]|uniref:GntR family transcriptional regulator n=1 Tax=Mycolicibacterium sp. P9-64 TaxID=2024612 RepID=UPI0011EE90CF|nr:GntR family transcriptional regulator [Mycolicibacterium sp. P9-64]KAA0083188.1 GntR family transcriptional regulator [Mycolicibacterium sp. P9-64]